MSGRAARALVTAVILVAVCAGIGIYIGLYLINVPGSVAATSTATGTQLYLATVPAAELTDPHPDWVSYYVVNSSSTDWRHDTTFQVPANTLVHFTIYQYDTATGLRNPYFSQTAGTDGSVLYNGKPAAVVNPAAPAHTFAIPQIGLSVPLPGANANAKNLCANAPCPLSDAHVTVSFTFRTPAKGLYRWQCFVPCAAGFYFGNGGPMQTIGWMSGEIKVV